MDCIKITLERRAAPLRGYTLSLFSARDLPFLPPMIPG